MIRSMTGYGSAVGTSGDLNLEIELRAVNHRHLDIAVKIPRLYLFAEEGIKKRVAGRVGRGKVDVFVTVDATQVKDAAISVNEPLAGAYIAAFKRLSAQFGIADEISNLQIGRMPEVLSIEQKKADPDAFSRDVLAILDEAIDGFDAMRKCEGARLGADLAERLCNIEALAAEVKAKSPETVALYRAKLEQRMREVLEGVQIEESRILTEAALFADKVAVDEEITRLGSHIAQFRDMLSIGGIIGRKLDFLLQELGRETNTIGAKCNDTEIGGTVIELKAELEKIREQVQNIE